MKRFLVTLVLAVSVAAAAQSDAQQQAPAAQAPAAQDPAGQKTIKDPLEYNSYISASGLQDAGQRAAQLEQFVKQYPNSVVKEEALEGAMVGYQQAGNAAKTNETATALLQLNPNNISALAVMVYGKRMSANSDPKNSAALFNELLPMAERGISALKTQTKQAGVSQEDFDKRKKLLTVVFNGAAGQAALAGKNYAAAQAYLAEAVRGNPNDVNDIYPLALAYLQATPKTDEAQLKGLFFIARATALAPTPQAKTAINDFGSKSYKIFHGGVDGWEELVALAKDNAEPPATMRITKYEPPPPSEQAKQFIALPFAETGFGEWSFILSNAAPADADAYWTKNLKGKPIGFQGEVIETGRTRVTMAVTSDGIANKTPEVEVMFAEPLRVAPAVGENLQVGAAPVSYEPKPFMMRLEQGGLIGDSAKKAGASVKKAPAKAGKKKPAKAPVKKKKAAR